jgi:hypothetical protein
MMHNKSCTLPLRSCTKDWDAFWSFLPHTAVWSNTVTEESYIHQGHIMALVVIRVRQEGSRVHYGKLGKYFEIFCFLSPPPSSNCLPGS